MPPISPDADQPQRLPASETTQTDPKGAGDSLWAHSFRLRDHHSVAVAKRPGELWRLGDAYCARLFRAYADTVPAEADLVCYWVVQAQQQIAAGFCSRAGLVTTNSIRGGANRRVLEPIAAQGAISDAWSDEPWTLDGAAVRVSLICWGSGPAAMPTLNGVAVPAIHADLTAGAANLTTARRLKENAGAAFQGSKKVGPFEVSGEIARRWLMQPSNANGRSNQAVLRPSWIGIDVARRARDQWITDFTGFGEAEAAYFAGPYAHVVENVYIGAMGRAGNSLIISKKVLLIPA